MSKSHNNTKKDVVDKSGFQGGSPQDRLIFISDLIDCLREKSPKSLLITMSDLSEYLKKQSPLSPSNLYRKQYGNLEHLFDLEHFNYLFDIQSSVIKLQPLGVLKISMDKNQISSDLYFKCMNMHTIKNEHERKTMKIIGKNQCKNCLEQYVVLINSNSICEAVGNELQNKNHQPKFDWNLNEDVMKCDII